MEAASGCATTSKVPLASTPPSALAITNVGVEPKMIDINQQQVAAIRYELTQPATVVIDLVGEEGRLMRRLDAGQQTAGMHTMTWDGRATDGQSVPRGVYRYVVVAKTPHSSLIYDPSRTTGGEELTPWDFTFDKDTGTLKWVMPKAGYVRLRIGLEGFPHLRTLLDWEPLEAGEHSVVWDGLDASGLIRLRDHPTLSIKLQTFALPWNTLIVKYQQTADSAESATRRPAFGGGGSASGGSTQQTDLPTSDELRTMNSPAYPPLHRPDAAYLHARHARAICREANLRVELPEVARSDTEGRPVLSGLVPVRVLLDERDAQSLINSRFEVALFEDTTFLFEEEEGSHPFTYLWDTAHLPPGEHLLTINVLSYDDHYGVTTLPVMIER